MDDDYKSRIFAAVENYSAKEIAPKRKNDNPEERVVAEHLEWFKDNNYFIKRMESKAKNINGVWRASGVGVGTPDLIGCSPDGLFIACEVKALGRRSTLRGLQREYLVEVIKRGGYGFCSDDTDYLTMLLKKLNNLPLAEIRLLLLRELP